MLEFLLTTLAAVAAHYGAPADIWGAIVNDFSNITEPTAFAAFLQVLMIDLVLAGRQCDRRRCARCGPIRRSAAEGHLDRRLAALVLRIIFALVVTQLLQIIGLILVGGLLLLWVAWKMWRELRHQGESAGSEEIQGDEHSGLRPAKSFAAAVWAVAVADVSMSLDNVLAVAGAARDHPGILIVGLIFAVILMGVAANFIARYIERYRWIGYVGLLVIIYVAFKMIYDGWVHPEVGLGKLFA